MAECKCFSFSCNHEFLPEFLTVHVFQLSDMVNLYRYIFSTAKLTSACFQSLNKTCSSEIKPLVSYVVYISISVNVLAFESFIVE